MWPFTRTANKREMAGLKTVRVNGFKFQIRRLNPLLDFSSSNMPQIFSSYQGRRAQKEDPSLDKMQRAQRDMYAVIEAGLVSPELVPVGKGDQRGKEDGMTVEDLFRDGDTGTKLYLEIMAHSLNRTRGIAGNFTSMIARWKLFMSWRRSMANDPAPSSSEAQPA